MDILINDEYIMTNATMSIKDIKEEGVKITFYEWVLLNFLFRTYTRLSVLP